MSLVQQGKEPAQVVCDGTLLDAQGSNTNGTWQPLGRGCAPISITVRGTFSLTCTIYVSNQLTRPLDTDNAQGVLQAFTSTGSIGSDYTFRWIKAAVSNWTSGNVTVDVMAGK